MQKVLNLALGTPKRKNFCQIHHFWISLSIIKLFRKLMYKILINNCCHLMILKVIKNLLDLINRKYRNKHLDVM